MTPKWIIETAAFPEDVEPMILALKEQGIEYKIPEKNFYEIDDCLSLYLEDDCVIFCGSLNTAKALRRKAKWIPGVY